MGHTNVVVKMDIQRREVRDTMFENILNFRDVGKTINEFLGKKYGPLTGLKVSIQGLRLTMCPRLVAEGKIFRSARPGELDSE